MENVGDPLLVRPEILDSQLAKPRIQRVHTPACAVERRGQVGVPPCLLPHPPGGYTELCACRLFDKIQVGRIIRRVMQRLGAQDAAIPDQVGEEAEPVIGPAEAYSDGFRYPARYPHPVPLRQVVQWLPPAEGQERVIS